MRVGSLLLAYIGSVTISGHAKTTDSCDVLEALAPEFQETIEATRKPDGTIEFGVMWYPFAIDSPFWTTTKIVVDGVVYGSLGIYERAGKYKSAAHISQRHYSNGYFIFELNVTPEELARIRKIVKDGKSSFSFKSIGIGCVPGTCKPVNKGTALKIPPPFNMVGALTAIYLATLKACGSKRVRSIHFMGKSKWKSLASPWMAVDIGTSVVIVGGTGLILMVVLDKLGRLFFIYDDDDEQKDVPKEPEKEKPAKPRSPFDDFYVPYVPVS